MTKFYEAPNPIDTFGARGSSRKLGEAAMLQRKSDVWDLISEADSVKRVDHLMETMSTSDFDYVLTADLNTMLMGMLARYPVSYKMWTKPSMVNDFKVNTLAGLVGNKRLMQVQKEGTDLPVTYFTDDKYTISVQSYAESVALTRQAIMNDSLGAFNEIPGYFSEEAAFTAENLATQMIADKDGAHATFFTSGRGNLITSELSIASVKEAVVAMSKMVDPTSRAVYREPKGLIVPPALKVQAEEIVNALTMEVIDDTNDVRTTQRNPYAGLQVAVDQEIPLVSVDNAVANKQWYLYADPNVGRTAAVSFATMRGYLTPRLYRKAPDAMMIGGGSDMYSYQNNTIDYAIKWDIGAAQMDYTKMVASQPAS